MHNITALLSTLITASHILHHHSILDAFGHVSVRNPLTNSTFFIPLQLGPLVVSGPQDIGEYLISDGSPVNGTVGGYAERFIHSEIFKRYANVNAVVHSHAEDVLPYTVLDGQANVGPRPVYHMAGFMGTLFYSIFITFFFGVRIFYPSLLLKSTLPGSNVPNFDIETAYEASDPRDLLVNTPRLGAALAASFGVNTSAPTEPLHTVVLQRGHGFVTLGSSVEQVTDYAYYVASNARVQTRALLLNDVMGGGEGGVHYLSGQEQKDTANMNAWIAFKPWRMWVKEVERSGMYVNELGTPPIDEN